MTTRPATVQLAVIGAMQRSHPALTQAWLQWTGIKQLDRASFDTIQFDGYTAPGTSIHLKPSAEAQLGWAMLCNAMKLPSDAPERSQMPVTLAPKSPAHDAFWSEMKTREREHYAGPLEWWWRLLVLRMRGVRAASALLVRQVFGDDDVYRRAVLSFTNPSLKSSCRQSRDLYTNGKSYKQPTHVVLSVPVRHDSGKLQGLAFPLVAGSLRDRFVPALLDAAVARTI